MIKRYETTLDETVHAHMCLLEQSGVMARDMWIGSIVLPIIVLLLALITFLTGGFAPKMIVVITIMFLGSVPLYLLFYKRNTRHRIRKYLIKAHGTDRPVPCEFTLDEKGVKYSKLGQETQFSWSGVREITETAESLEIFFTPTATTVIPKRIFANSSEIEEWIAFIEEHSGIKREIRGGAK